jgi:hypothetical protein
MLPPVPVTVRCVSPTRRDSCLFATGEVPGPPVESRESTRTLGLGETGRGCGGRRDRGAGCREGSSYAGKVRTRRSRPV